MKYFHFQIRFFTVFIALIATGGVGLTQPVNNDCVSARHLPVIDSYCSEPGEFSNAGATGLGPITTSCLIDLENDVWFTFIPTAPAVLLQVSGAVNNLGTLQGPGIFVFEGTCGNLIPVGCNTVSAGLNTIELTVSDLVLGRVYYVAVIGANPGTFQLCADQFIPPPQPESDCDQAVILCDKSSFFVEQVTGIGDPLVNEVSGTCIREELASVWYKWTCETSGSLTFTLTPNNNVPGFESDDLDFVLYELTAGLNNCNPQNRRVIRCEAAGAIVNRPLSEWAECNGPTGLREGETDTIETAGCMLGQNNFVAPAQLVAGRSYALVINNFSESGQGFSIDFGGTATFVGPEADFDVEAVQAFECDKTIIFTNESSSQTDSIVNWSWNFGAGANPTFAQGTGPHDVIYESFGDKVAALTVESSRGCIVTKVIDLFVEPCCADTSTLDVQATSQDLVCQGVPAGVIQAQGISGAPVYQYSLNGVDYQPSGVFPQLGPGEYTVFIQDEKGCENTTTIEVMDAPPYTVDAGDSIFVDLGDPAQLNAIVSPFNVSSVSWNPLESLVFEGDSLSPIACAPGTTTYTVRVTNSAGCEATDDVVIAVNLIRPVYIPNVISANQDGINDYFYIQAGPAVSAVEVFRIFDRWGGLMYERVEPNVLINDESDGWDGTVNDQVVNPGVYTWYAKIRFKDNEVLTYSGTVTVVR